ncbi:MFS transporter [Siphonobacter sp. BAB-5385]|uniref:MFS transporter n=1 Tax=Siphonobacter curvatus TaxID=2094562 RepID=A0A2S7ITL9_9BACT|nr:MULTISPECIES: MFS transporter [Siphonobacter]OZI07439.1 MFS transporter [Siphonobacter sp. BAB-5385]PMD97045.1 MFS transporter [Siphonobacter sp. BAB-5405]PQA61006.1 MFS transporter [Siphonobacter curvatus]
MIQSVNRDRLFLASCFGLITTAMIFGIRAGILPQLGAEFGLTSKELGYVNQMAFLGFPIAMIVGGPLYNIIGPKRIVWVAFVTHLIGIVSTIFADGFWTLLLSTFFVGFGNGTIEAACNPMVADMYEGNQTTKMLSRFHMWFPGGIVIGSLVSKFMTDAGLGWQLQMGVILIPLVLYGVLFFGQLFPESTAEEGHSNTTNIKAMLSPLYIFMLICMALTAISEFGPEQWVGPILEKAGASPMLILALVTGLMAVGRYFAGPLVHSLNPTGVLWASSVIATIGIVLMSQATGAMVYVSAVIFAIGVCYFWPTMIGFVAEYIPKSGAFGMSIIGGMGMFSTSIFQPIIGGWIDDEMKNATARGLTGDAAQLAAGQETLDNMAIFPAILIIAFGVLWFVMRNKKPGHHHDETLAAQQPQL